jgi:hypothetical protein
LNVAGSNETYLGLHVKWPTLFSDFNQIWVLSKDFYKIPDIIFYGNPYGDSRTDRVARRKDGHDEGDGHFCDCERAYKLFHNRVEARGGPVG